MSVLPEDELPSPWLDIDQQSWGWIEYGMADYMARWLPQWTGRPYDGNTAGMPTAAANCAVTVVYRWFKPILDRLANAEEFLRLCDEDTRRAFIRWTWEPVFIGMAHLSGAAEAWADAAYWLDDPSSVA